MSIVPVIRDLPPALLSTTPTDTFRVKYDFPVGVTFELLPTPSTGERARYGREHWPPGPWHNEPFDKIVWTDTSTGLSCMLVRGPVGSWCGYVGVTPVHPWYGVGYSECTQGHKAITQKQALHKARRARERASSASERKMWQNLVTMTERWYHPRASCGYDHTPEHLLDAHGGITYSAHCAGSICHPHDAGDAPTYWFGFDCAHSTDVAPGMLASSKWMHDAGHEIFTDHLDYDPVTGAMHKYSDSLGEQYRDVAYCKQETERLAAQLANYAHTGATV